MLGFCYCSITAREHICLFEPCSAIRLFGSPRQLLFGLIVTAFVIDCCYDLGECLAYALLGLGYLNGGAFFAGGFNRRSIRPIVLIRSMLSLESVRFS